jgi:serine/threonine protein phosphatase PrpC
MAENYFGATDTGRLRDNNEDAFIAQEVSKGRYILACAIDGVGGYDGGEVAAALAKETIIKVLSAPFDDVEKTLHLTLRSANERIFEEKQQGKGNANMACVLTLVLADVVNNKFYYAHIGDTRLYLLRDRSLVKVTKDHSFVGYLEDSGRLSEELAMNHPKRNEINKALGFDPHLAQADSFDIGNSPFLPGDILFLCSDGLSDMVNSNEIVSILTSSDSLQQKGTKLIAAANEAGGKDNITVVLVHNTKQKQQHQATKPLEKVSEEAPVQERTRVEALASAEKVSVTEPDTPRRFGPIMIVIAIAVLILLAAVAIWFFTRDKKEAIVVPVAVAPVTKSPQEQMLHDSLSYGSNNLFLQTSGSDTFSITDTLIVSKDSLHIRGNGMVLRCDSSFQGPVFFLLPGTAYVMLENMVFKDFPIAVISGTKGLHLTNVKFINCDIPVQYNIFLPQEQNISGLIHDSFFSHNDSGLTKPAAWP